MSNGLFSNTSGMNLVSGYEAPASAEFPSLECRAGADYKRL